MARKSLSHTWLAKAMGITGGGRHEERKEILKVTLYPIIESE